MQKKINKTVKANIKVPKKITEAEVTSILRHVAKVNLRARKAVASAGAGVFIQDAKNAARKNAALIRRFGRN